MTFVTVFRRAPRPRRARSRKVTTQTGVRPHADVRVTQFTEIHVHARLRVPSGANEDQARRLLAKAEEACLVTNSLKVHPQLETVVEFEGA